MTFLKHKPVSINNLFDEFFAHLPSDTTKENLTTPVNIYENNDDFTVDLVASGCNKEDFKINVEKEILTISYHKKEETEPKNCKILRKDFSVKSFKRSFNLDSNVNIDDIKARYENGILSVILPKKESIQVQLKEILVL